MLTVVFLNHSTSLDAVSVGSKASTPFLALSLIKLVPTKGGGVIAKKTKTPKELTYLKR